MRALAFLSAFLLAAPPAPPLQVSAQDGRVTIRATRVPLSEVLQELARKTGMDVVYEVPAPRQPVTIAIENQPEEEAVARLLGGVALSWGVKMSANGRRVERLVLADPSKRGARPTPRPEEPSDVPSPRLPSSASYPSEPDPEPAPQPTPTPTPFPRMMTPRPTPSPTASPSARPSPTPTPRPTATPTPTASPRPTPTPTPRPTPTPTPRATPTPRT